MSKGKWTGLTWIWLAGGSMMTGQADFFGQMSGDGIAFIYPDSRHALRGTFSKGQLTVCQFCYVSTVRFIKGHLPEVTFTTPQSGPYYSFDAGNRTDICQNPMTPDAYEHNHVIVKQSKMRGGGEGLFAKINLPAERVVSFYNGIKENENDIEEEKGDWEANAYKIMDMLDKDPETGLAGVIDIPEEYISTKNYV